ncbi:MAG: FlgD immunoglobulin-like domain containing protein, partial [candidate division Zixibacteria bacterium]
DGIGSQCFLPADVDSARYVFEYMIFDNCLRGEPPAKCPTDSVIITVIIGTPPSIECPPLTNINLCAPESVCLPLNILPIDANITIAEEGATYENGQLCFYADQSGVYTFNVTALNDCGESTCQVVFDVTIGTPPIIDCPTENILVNQCQPDSVCIPLNIIPSDAIVTLTGDDAIFENGELCFYADLSRVYTFDVMASNECGDTSCHIVVDVTIGTPPTIDCPTEEVIVNLCAPDSVCQTLSILPVDAIVTIAEEGATYENGELCFYASQTGFYTFNVTALNDCGESTCQVVFDVTVGTPPSIECPQPQIVKLCGPGYMKAYIGQFAPDIQISITPTVERVNDSVIFFAESPGEYCFEVRGENECGFDVCTFCVTVEFDSLPVISIPDTVVSLCQPEEICLPVTYNDPDGNISEVRALDPYTIVNDAVCFTPAEPGVYEIIVSAKDECGNEAFDTATVIVTMNELPTVLIEDTAVFNCYASDICLPVTFGDVDGEIDSIEVEAPAHYDADNQQVCLYVDAPGNYEINIAVYDDCGAMAADVALITASFNSPPKLAVGSYPNTACELEEIYVPVMLTDIDDNVVSLTAVSSCGEEITFNEIDSSFYWTPSAFSGCNLTFTVTDECGETDVVILDIVIEQKPQPRAICPNDTILFICEPGQKCMELENIPGVNINIVPETFVYSSESNTICYFADGNRTDTLMIIDANECGADTCSFVIETKLNSPPIFSGNIKPSQETFCDSLYLCLDIGVDDPDDNMKDIYTEGGCPGVTYNEETKQLCLMIRKEIHCQIDLIAVDSCNASARISIPIDAVPDKPPVIDFPDIEGIVRCPTDEEPIVISDICVTDPDFGDVTLALDSGLGEFAFNPISGCGTLTFVPPANDSVEYCFKFKATDDCSESYKTYCIKVYPATICETCIHVSIEGPPKCVNNGAISTVNVTVDAIENVAAFDILLSYDATVIYFLTADLGTAINGWEFFTYRYGKDGNCIGGTCPSGLLRLVAIADVNNGPLHPPQDQYYPAGVLASVTFKVSSDVNIGGQNVPVSFFWFDCGDNTFSDISGQYLYLDKLVISREGNIIWDETNDDVYPEFERPFGIGASDECVKGLKDPPIRCIDFKNGEFCIIHPDSIDARGDINLNGIAYEIADAVLYTNFFISGLKAFRISPPAQIAASDINGDGLPLTIADLVHLVRIIIGDISPMPKFSAVEIEVPVTFNRKDNISTVSIDSPESIGAALLVFSYQGDSFAEPEVINKAESMSMLTGFNDYGEFRVLLYSLQAGHMIEAGESELVSITVPEGVELKLIDVEIADYYANAMMALIDNQALPNKLALSQNYPNPFNPRTSFTLTMPEASDYEVIIYNVTGQAIKTWTGYGQAGQHHFEWDGTDSHGASVSSGIYLYKASAAGSQEIRKMVLLK